jgi:hypothetical protein
MTDEAMANVYFRTNYRSELTPAYWKDPANWPAAVREEWSDDEGKAAANRHREELLKGYRAARDAIDAFKPDFIVIFGDDQYENFKEDLLPPFCIFAMDEYEVGGRRNANPNAATFTQMQRAPVQSPVAGSKAIGTYLANQLVNRGFDISCSWQMLHMPHLAHAFGNTVDYLDWDRRGFPYTIVPFHVSCYGDHLRVPAPGVQPVTGRRTATSGATSSPTASTSSS